MKKFLIALMAVALVSPAFADGGRGHGRDHGRDHGWSRGGGDWGRGGGWGWRDDWIFPALIGGAVMYDLARPQTVYVPQPEPVYAPPNVAASPPVQYWYFCPAANAYYPYVPSCPTGWRAVPATPPAASAAVAPTTPQTSSSDESSPGNEPDDEQQDAPDDGQDQ